MKIKRTHGGRILAILLTFVPPLIFVYWYPKGFYVALDYAGAFVAILLVFLPAAMVWKLKNYQGTLKKLFILLVIFLSLSIVALDILQEFGKLQYLISEYLPKK